MGRGGKAPPAKMAAASCLANSKTKIKCLRGVLVYRTKITWSLTSLIYVIEPSMANTILKFL